MMKPPGPPDVRFEIHAQITLPHAVTATADEINQALNEIEERFRALGGDVTMSFLRTTKGKDEAEQAAIPPPQGHGFL